MKTFSNLIQEVQNAGLCHKCGGCVSFCTAINYASLTLDNEGRPVYSSQDKCIECGICYLICPARGELEKETKNRLAWSESMGRVMDTTVACAAELPIREAGTDGGVVTALLTHLLDTGHIDGAIVSKKVGLFQHRPWLATTREEILEAAGSYFDASRGMVHFGETYSTFTPSVAAFQPLVRKGLRRVAMVGVPCQIQTFRKMETLNIVPSDSIHISLGLFCNGNFRFGEEERKKLEEMGGFKWEQVVKINLRDSLIIRLTDGRMVSLDLDSVDFMKRKACKYCTDYSAEYADLSFGGVGAPFDWTTVLVRTPKGRAVFADAKGPAIHEFAMEDNPRFAIDALRAVRAQSDGKKDQAYKWLKKLT